jgi:hypothetical protein
MRAEDGLALSGTVFSVLSVGALIWTVGLDTVWNVVKAGMQWILDRPFAILDWIEENSKKTLKPKRTEVQKLFDTDMTWKEVRRSIGIMEHELFDYSKEWTHDVKDCVHPDCNRRALEKAAAENLSSEIERLGDLWMGVQEKLHAVPESSYECPDCHAVSYNPNDIANRYCGACHRFHALLPDPGRTEKR